MKFSDYSVVRKLAVRLSIRLQTGLDFLLGLPVLDLLEIAEEATERGR